MSTTKKYKDAPRYKTIVGYESAFKNAFKINTEMMVKDLAKNIKKMIVK